jgi:hypothetical protein
VGIKGEDLDRVAVGDPRFLQGRRGVIRGEFIREHGDTSCRSAIGGTSSRTPGHLWCWTHDSGILIDAHQPLGVTLDPGDDGGRGRATWFA